MVRSCAAKEAFEKIITKGQTQENHPTMFRSAARFFGTKSTALDAAPVKIQPYLAAKQFVPEDASKSKVRALRRRENRMKRQIIRDVNNLKKHSLKREEFKVDPVLGAENNKFISRMYQELEDPANLAYGYNREEFEKLLYGAQKAALDSSIGGEVITEQITKTEEKKKRALLTILNMKNSNAADKRKLATEMARKEFARFEGDTGSPEVQAAIMTVKIHFGFEHVKKAPKDKAHIQSVRELVQQRQSILKYLKRDDPEKYYYTIAKLGLTDDVVTREFNMDRQYFQDYQVWGDKQLVKLSEKQKKREQHFAELQKKVAEYNQLARKNHALLNN